MSDDVAEVLRNFLQAYPEDVFPTPPPERQAKDAAAAHVMRELAYPVMREALAEIERLRAIIAPCCDCGHPGMDHEPADGGACDLCNCRGYHPRLIDGDRHG